MFNHQHYVPILKWKMGEYQALSRLSDSVKDRITPLLEIPPVGFDFETQQNRKSIDEHLADFGSRLKAKWQSRQCFVDLKHLRPNDRLNGGRHFVEGIFGSLRDEGCSAIPVVSIASDRDFRAAVANVNRQDQRGICLRLVMGDFDPSSLATDIDRLLHELGVRWADVDLVVDFGALKEMPVAASVLYMRLLLGMLPPINRWRTLTVAGTAYPSSVAALETPFATVARSEWLVYKEFVNQLDGNARIPTFGDYGIAHPDLVELDMRLIKPFAKLRYTYDNNWHIGRGTSVRSNGFDQFREMCTLLKQQSYFSGTDFSQGDDYIEKCASGKVTTGNLSTWVWVSTNRHLTKVVADLATLHAI